MKKERNTILFALFALLVLCPAKSMAQNIPPIADAGLPRYAAQDPVVLDGTGSYDPDGPGQLSCTWRQIAGPSVSITYAETDMPTISGFIQTDAIQECEFELVVSDGELASLPDTVKVIIVPTFSESTMVLENDSFDPQKPTIIFFDGHRSNTWPKATTGGGRWANKAGSNNSAWQQRANIVSFYPYVADDASSDRFTSTYYRCADMIIVYLSTVAPDYNEYIQTMGHSLGGHPAMDVAIFLNETYADRRYAINRVTLFDTTPYLKYSHKIRNGLIERVDGEQCWIENYVCTSGGYLPFYDNIFNVAFDKFDFTSFKESHSVAVTWYGKSLTGTDMNLFNNGLVAGVYWSIIGPGRNLQLASTPGAQTYKFKWYGSTNSGYMDFFDESVYPGRLPEPVTLLAYSDALDPNDEPAGALLTCKESENAVGYQLLFGSDPYRVMDYDIISDTTIPPTEIITTFPFEETFWTIRARDQYGSTIYADPLRVSLENMPLLTIDNLTNGKRYGYIQHAINDANSSDEIVVGPGIYQENISFKGKNLTLRSTEPNNSAVVAATVIDGNDQGTVVTFSNAEDANCILAGFTITGGNNENGGGIYCGDNSAPTITNCIITNNSATQGGGGGMYTENSSPTVLNCIFKGNSANLGGGVCCNTGNPTMINCTFSRNTAFWAGGIYNIFGSTVLTNCIFWDNSDPEIGGIAEAAYSDIRGGWPGEGNIDVDPLFADPDDGDYHLKSQAGRWELGSQSWVIDDVTSPCIDAGDPGTPIGLEPLLNGGIINMGAYGGTVEASKSSEN